MKLKEIGAHFGIGESAVSQTSYRIQKKSEKDKNLKKMIEAVEKEILM